MTEARIGLPKASTICGISLLLFEPARPLSATRVLLSGAKYPLPVPEPPILVMSIMTEGEPPGPTSKMVVPDTVPWRCRRRGPAAGSACR